VLKILVERENEDFTELAIAPYFPKEKEEFWWVVVGDTKTNKLYGIKRINFGAKLDFVMKFIAPEPGKYNLNLILYCDSYLGCDEFEELNITVLENPDLEESEEDEEED